jgi:IS30 family transposase
MKIIQYPEMESYVRKRIRPPYRWSPERIAGRMKQDIGYKVRPDTIYKYLYGAYGAGLTRYLHYKRERRGHRKPSVKRVMIPQRTSIHERPSAISQRRIFGHGEADTMGRPWHVSAQTLVVIRERVSRKLFARKVSRLARSMDGFRSLQVQARCASLTFDNGVENVRHQQLRIPTYFCDPYSSWQKGSVEQGIGMIRRSIPKQADLKHYSQKDIDGILEQLNGLPMKCLGFKTPNEVYAELSMQKS